METTQNVTLASYSKEHCFAPRHRGRPAVLIHHTLGPPSTGKTTHAMVIANQTKNGEKWLWQVNQSNQSA